GLSTIASGYNSTAMGRGITAQGNYSFGIGLDTTTRTITQANTMAIMGGNVGIGTVSPSEALLQINSAGNGIKSYSSFNGGYGVYGESGYYGVYGVSNMYGVYGVSSGTSGYGVYGSGNIGVVAIGNQGTNPYDFYGYGPQTYFSGNVGIGDLTPTEAKLVVNGTAGNFTGVWSNLSDIRLKENVQTIENALDTVSQLRGVTFNWIDSERGAGLQRGFIAQEVEGIIPEWVRDDGNGYLMLEKIGVEALLVEAIKGINSVVTMTDAPTTTPSVFVDANGNIKIGNTAPKYKLDVAGAVMLEASDIPTTTPGYAGIFASSTTASSTELFALDSNGNVTQISPHNDDGEWIYNSMNVKTGEVTQINMEKVIKKLEKLSGEKLMVQYNSKDDEIKKEDNKNILSASSTVEMDAGELDTSALSDLSMLDIDWILEKLKNLVVSAKEFIADRITTKELCVEDVCINKDQMKELLEKSGIRNQESGIMNSNDNATTTASTTIDIINTASSTASTPVNVTATSTEVR
ncbi:MAG: tail fiber domain-containing protein, partial [Proteobacteria bacterium]|nr:tail fiber domain-containing protein [Pseudomonadota bacterium]